MYLVKKLEGNIKLAIYHISLSGAKLLTCALVGLENFCTRIKLSHSRCCRLRGWLSFKDKPAVMAEEDASRLN